MQNEIRLLQTYIVFLKLIYLILRNNRECNSKIKAETNYLQYVHSKTDIKNIDKIHILSRQTVVHISDGKKETYSYNQNSQVSAISGIVSGKLAYSNARPDKLSFSEISIVKKYGYNEAGLISSLSYTSDTGLQTGFEYLYDKNFNITQRTQLDTGNKDTYEYDAVNHLVASKLQGKFYNDTYEQFDLSRMSEIARDIDGLAYEKDENVQVLNGQFFPADKVTLDENAKSFVYDFGEEKEIQKFELFKNNLSIASRVRERDLHIYTKQNQEDGWSELTSDNWYYEVDSRNQSIHINLKNLLKTQFIKIRTIWDDRDIDNNNVSDYVTFSHDNVQKMIRIWTVNNTRDEDYTYDKNSNRTSLTKDGQTEEYLYYKNTSGGNTARVMYDGKWWYTYDKNGNRTARASNAVYNKNKLTVDTNSEYWEYEWDYHNRLVKVQQFNAPDNSTNVFVEYTYDALNRRIERISKTKAEQGITQYAYGRNGALTYQKKKNENIKTTRTYSYLNDQIIGFTDLDRDGTKYVRYTVTDIQGSVSEVYDEENNLLWKSGYTAFGIKAGETTNLLDFDGLYTGCDYDAETGLTYHWNRWRSENGNSWLSEDFARDGLNWYGYARQNPINFTDPDGRETTVFIIHANSGWEKLVNGSHVAIYFSNPGVNKYGELNPQILYDPSGSYIGPESKCRYDNGVFANNDASPEKFIASVLNRENGEYINSYTISTTPEQEAKMIDRALELGDGILGMNCADNVSDVLKEIGFKHVITPGGLEKQLKESSSVNRVGEYKNEEN